MNININIEFRRISDQVRLLALLMLLINVHANCYAGAVVQPNEFWISPVPTTNGVGTLENPFDGSTVTKFDSAMNAMPQNTTIHILAGKYETSGNCNNCGGWPVRAGQHIIGAGKDITILHMTNGLRSDRNVIGSEAYNICSNMLVQDLTIDCSGTTNLQGGIELEGDRIVISRVKVTGLYVDDSREQFAIAAWNFSFPYAAFMEISDCEVTHWTNASATHGGISSIAIGTDPPHQVSATVRNNRVILDSVLGIDAYGINVGSCTNGLVMNNFISGASAGFYCDGGSNTNLVISGNVFQNCVNGAHISGHPQVNVIFARNVINLGTDPSGTTAGAAFYIEDNCFITNALVFGNVVDMYTAYNPLLHWAFVVDTANGLAIFDNTIDARLRTQTVGLTLGSLATNVYNNVDLSGSFITNYNQVKLPSSMKRISVAGSSYGIGFGDKYVGVQNATGATITLPNAANAAGQEFIVAKEVSGTGTVTLNVVASGGNVNGGSTVTFNGDHEGRTIMSDGSNWFAR